MKVKVELYLSSPFAFRPETPVDGLLSYLLAGCRDYDLRKEEGTFLWGNLELPLSVYGYVKDLPIRKVEYDNGFFYAVSVLFGRVKMEKKVIYRKFPNYLRVYELLPSADKKFPIRKATKLTDRMGSGKIRGMQVPLEVFSAKRVWFYADVLDDRIDEFVDLIEAVKYTGIGKKTGHGYGQVERVEIIPEDDFEGESYDGLFVETEERGRIPARPLPLADNFVLPEGCYLLELYASVLPPYYLPVKLERCMFVYPYPMEIIR
jgi:hypothetical protein